MPQEALNLVKKVEYKLRTINVNSLKQPAAKGGVVQNKENVESF